MFLNRFDGVGASSSATNKIEFDNALTSTDRDGDAQPHKQPLISFDDSPIPTSNNAMSSSVWDVETSNVDKNLNARRVFMPASSEDLQVYNRPDTESEAKQLLEAKK